MKRAIYAGSFDPFTNGHKHILLRALNLFDEVTLLVGKSPSKKTLFTARERVEMLREEFKDYENVKVDFFQGLLVDYAKHNSINVLIRGLRPTGDFESEFQMASMNKKLFPEIETVFLMTEGENYYLSSSLVKEIYKHGTDIKSFVPDVVLDWLDKKGRDAI